MAPGDDTIETALQSARLQRCAIGQTSVRIDLFAMGTVSDIPSLRQTLTVSCLPCEVRPVPLTATDAKCFTALTPSGASLVDVTLLCVPCSGALVVTLSAYPGGASFDTRGWDLDLQVLHRGPVRGRQQRC
eukprot:957679-Rhodomonas_salina.5